MCVAALGVIYDEEKCNRGSTRPQKLSAALHVSHTGDYVSISIGHIGVS